MCPRVNSASKKWVPAIPLGEKVAGAWGWRPTTLAVPNVKKPGALTHPDPLGPSRRPVVGETFTFTISLLFSMPFLTLKSLFVCYIFFCAVSFIHTFQNILHGQTDSCSVGFTMQTPFSRSLRDFVKEFERPCLERSFIYPAVNSWSLTSKRNHLSYKMARYEEVTTKPVGMQLFILSVCYVHERQYCVLRPYICRVVKLLVSVFPACLISKQSHLPYQCVYVCLCVCVCVCVCLVSQAHPNLGKNLLMMNLMWFWPCIVVNMCK